MCNRRLLLRVVEQRDDGKRVACCLQTPVLVFIEIRFIADITSVAAIGDSVVVVDSAGKSRYEDNKEEENQEGVDGTDDDSCDAQPLALLEAAVDLDECNDAENQTHRGNLERQNESNDA